MCSDQRAKYRMPCVLSFTSSLLLYYHVKTMRTHTCFKDIMKPPLTIFTQTLSTNADICTYLISLPQLVQTYTDFISQS